jgi:hypothetical protein
LDLPTDAGIGDQEHNGIYRYDASDHADAEPATAEVLAHVPTGGQRNIHGTALISL